MPPQSVFVVDDESVIASTLAAILNVSGYRATAFQTAEAAIQAAESEHPDILVTDVWMPAMTGIDLAIRFKSLLPKCKVLLFSGLASTIGLLNDARAQGHTFALLTKPVHPNDLLAAIRQL